MASHRHPLRQPTKILAIFLVASCVACADRPPLRQWDDLTTLPARIEIEVGAQLAYAAFLATEPADYPAAEAVLLSGARWYPQGGAFIDALFELWRVQGKDDKAVTQAVLQLLRPIADANPRAPRPNLAVARAERQLSDRHRARRRLERCLRHQRWRHPELIREWLATLDPHSDGELASVRLAALATRPQHYGNWTFERAAADFLHEVAMHASLPKKRQLQARAWQHRLRAARNDHLQADAETALPLIKLLLRVDLTAETLTLVESLANSEQASPQTEVVRAHLYERQSRWQEALAIWLRLTAGRKTIAAYHLGTARCLEALDKHAQATDALATASRVTIDPKLGIPLGLTAAARYLAQNQPEQALAVLAGLPPHFRVRLARARAHHAAGQLEAALLALQKARQQRPKNTEILALLAATLYELDRLDAAKTTVDAALQNAPKSLVPQLQKLAGQIDQALAEQSNSDTFKKDRTLSSPRLAIPKR